MGIYQVTDRYVQAGAAPWGFPFPDWTSAEITTALWLDAADSDTITLVSGAVSQWDDKSGNDRHATQGTSGARPTVNATVHNSMPAVVFNGTSQFLASSLNMHGASQIEVFAVGSSASSSVSFVSIYTFSSPSRGLFLGLSTTGPKMTWDGRPDGGATYRSSGANLPSAITNHHLVSGSYDCATMRPYLYGAAGTTVSVSTTTIQARSNTVIGVTDNATGGWTPTRVSEVIVLSTITNTEDRQKIEGYLAHKWGLAGNLPSDHPYKNSAPRI